MACVCAGHSGGARLGGVRDAMARLRAQAPQAPLQGHAGPGGMAGRSRRCGDLLGRFSWLQSACLFEGVPAVATESGDGATHVFASRKLSTWSSRSLPFANCQGGGPHSHRARSGELGDSWRARRAPRALSTCGHVLVRAEPDAGHVERGVHADDQPRSWIPRVFSLRRVCRTDRCSVSCSLSRRPKDVRLPHNSDIPRSACQARDAKSRKIIGLNDPGFGCRLAHVMAAFRALASAPGARGHWAGGGWSNFRENRIFTGRSLPALRGKSVLKNRSRASRETEHDPSEKANAGVLRNRSSGRRSVYCASNPHLAASSHLAFRVINVGWVWIRRDPSSESAVVRSLLSLSALPTDTSRRPPECTSTRPLIPNGDRCEGARAPA